MDLSRQEQHRDRHDPRHQPPDREEPRAEDAAQAERPQSHAGGRQGARPSHRQSLTENRGQTTVSRQAENRGLSPVFARVVPFALFLALVAAQPLFEACCEGDWRWLTAWRGVIAGLALALYWPSYTELRGARDVAPGQWLLAIAVGLGVFAAWIHLDRPGIAFDSGPGFDPSAPDGRVDPLLAGLRLFGLALIVPVMEELFWRSFMLRWIDSRDFLAVDPRRASAFAFGATCGLFALEHSLWLAGLIAGAAYGWLYMRSRNLWVPILSH